MDKLLELIFKHPGHAVTILSLSLAFYLFHALKSHIEKSLIRFDNSIITLSNAVIELRITVTKLEAEKVEPLVLNGIKQDLKEVKERVIALNYGFSNGG